MIVYTACNPLNFLLAPISLKQPPHLPDYYKLDCRKSENMKIRQLPDWSGSCLIKIRSQPDQSCCCPIKIRQRLIDQAAAWSKLGSRLIAQAATMVKSGSCLIDQAEKSNLFFQLSFCSNNVVCIVCKCHYLQQHWWGKPFWQFSHSMWIWWLCLGLFYTNILYTQLLLMINE